MDCWLQWELWIDRSTNIILIKLNEHNRIPKVQWPKIECVSCKRLKIRWYWDIGDITNHIRKLQQKMINKYQKRHAFYKDLQKQCDDLQRGQYMITHGKTEQLLNCFKGQKPEKK